MTDQKLIAGIFNDFLGLYTGKIQTGIRPLIEKYKSHPMLMHHCVNNTETYYERMSQQESYILFLRKAEQPTEAYYTLEVEPDGTIRQTRTFYNQQNEDIELARDFLVKWQKQLKKKLAKEDYKLAVKSQSLRKKEIDELRSKGVRVNGVGYCNKLLAEILEEDLMEAGNRELEEQAA